MKVIFYHILCLFFLSKVISKIPEQEKIFLLNKYAKKIESPYDFSSYLEDDEFSAYSVPYDVDKVRQLLEKYGFNEEYNYFEDTGVQKNIKDQARCGSCWSFATSSSLAYRYNKLGFNISLSPQDALSCTIKDCDMGNNYIDPQLNMVKNGSLTEECFPYVSSDGKTIPNCPKKCMNEKEVYQKYYAKNSYILNTPYNEEELYDNIAIIIDELITYGPMFSTIRIFGDFMDLHTYNKTKCAETIYTYNGTNDYQGSHAVTLVGYGFQDNKFYWLMQNSWGKDDCDNGFSKLNLVK